MKRLKPDKRAARTRQALLQAFFTLVLEQRYEDIRISDIVSRARVGRSTLYQHFRSKDAILATSLQGPFRVLAALVDEPPCEQLGPLLHHFWENRAMARTIYGGRLRQVAVRVLARLIEDHWTSAPGEPVSLIIPTRLAALQIAEALLAPITAWVLGEARCSAAALALALRQTAAALVMALNQRRVYLTS